MARDKKKIDWKRLGEILVRRVRDSALSQSSVSISFYVILSMFPILIIIATIVPYFNISPAAITEYLDTLIPGPLLDVISPVVTNVLTNTSVGALSIGIVITIWSASKCMKYIQSGIDKAYGLQNPRLFITSRIFSVVFLIALVFMLIIFMMLFSFGEPLLRSLLQWLGDINFPRSFSLIKWGVSFIVLFVAFAFIYRITPNVKLRLKNVLPGALFTTVCLVVLVQIYAWYLGLSARSLSAYGILSAFFVLMIWMRLLAYIILLGAVLNASLQEYAEGTFELRESRIDDFVGRGITKLLNKLNINFSSKKKTGDNKENPPDDGTKN